MFDSANMRSLNLGFAAAIHHPQAGNGAGFLVGRHHGPSERPVSQRAVYQEPFGI